MFCWNASRGRFWLTELWAFFSLASKFKLGEETTFYFFLLRFAARHVRVLIQATSIAFLIQYDNYCWNETARMSWKHVWGTGISPPTINVILSSSFTCIETGSTLCFPSLHSGNGSSSSMSMCKDTFDLLSIVSAWYRQTANGCHSYSTGKRL